MHDRNARPLIFNTPLIRTAVLLTVVATVAVIPVAAATCESLTSLSLPHTTITAAQSVAAGSFNTPPGCTSGSPGCTTNTGLPSFCRVAGTSMPTSDSQINFEVWIPTDRSYNGKYEQLGNGGFAGAIGYSGLVEALKRGYATAATDDGTAGPPRGALSLVGHPERQIDFGYRALKETTNSAKAIIAAFTGKGPTHSYFAGCSDGGREALMEAQRFPDDFEGIIVGSPANDWVGLFTGHDWDMQALLNGPATGGVPDAYIPSRKLPILSNAALAQCAGQDGGIATDAFLNDPRDCRFGPATVQCKAGQDPDTCLTPAQVEAVRKIYRGPHNSQGQLLFPGYEPGSEASPPDWPQWITGTSSTNLGAQFTFSVGFWCDEVFENPSCNPLTVNFDSDYVTALNKVAPVVNSTNPDLSSFEGHGGRIIHYVGWADTAIAPMNSINYYNRVNSALGSGGHGGGSIKKIQEFYRLFMVPGMAHCSGGPGANVFGNRAGLEAPVIDAEHDLLKALERWVEEGMAPETITATKYVNDNPALGIAFQRPLCPYPQVSRYDGKGDPTKAASFTCINNGLGDNVQDPRDQ